MGKCQGVLLRCYESLPTFTSLSVTPAEHFYFKKSHTIENLIRVSNAIRAKCFLFVKTPDVTSYE